MLPLLLALTVGADSLQAQVNARIAAVPGAQVGVYYRRLSDNDTLSLAADTVFHAASTMKIPVMIELFRMMEAGQVTLAQPLLLSNRFTSIADGSPFSADSADDSDSTLYRRIGQRVPIRDLLRLMIQRSSNLATNTLIALMGAARADSAARALGATHTQVRRGVEDGKAFAAGINNVTTARDLATLMAAIAGNTAASRRSCTLMRDILLGQEFNTEIPAGLPPGTRVAHKTGSITGHLHDAAIVYPHYPSEKDAYVLVVMTRGIAVEKIARSMIADISRLVYARATSANTSP